MIRTTVTIKRANTTLYQHIPCQIDNLTMDDVFADHREVPMDLFRFTTMPGYVPVINQGDLLIDEVNIDPLTNAGVQYRVKGNTEPFAFHHVEAHVQKSRIK